MSLVEIILLGIALAMDCFSVSIATGLATHRVVVRPMAIMALSFGVFQAGMTWLGYIGASLFSQQIQDIDHWIAFALLLFLGCKMIYESCHEDNEACDTTSNWLSIKSILTLSVATSIDALAVGISFACLENPNGFSITLPVIIIGICSTLFSVIGLAVGIGIGKKVNLHAELLGGIVLVAIGIKILIEHIYG